MAPILIALAWLVGTVGAPSTLTRRPINLGFVAALALVAAAGVANWRALRSSLLSRGLLPALALAGLAFVGPAALHALAPHAWLSTGRACAALAWFALFFAFDSKMARRALSCAALTLLVCNLALALASRWLPANLNAFEIVQHEYVSGTPRFRGLANSPAPAGVWALVGIGLTDASPRKSVRWAGRAFGLLEAAATLSIALLAIPALLCALLPKRGLRWCLGLGAALVAAFILYFQPLELSVGSRTFEVSRRHESYGTDGLGPRYMPERTFALPGLALRGHATAYGKLAVRGLSCFSEHPLIGVGPGRFREACRVMAMNTFGEWSDQRDSHNQVGGLLAEVGVLGVALLCCAWLVLRRGYRLKELTAWQRAVWVGLLVCAFGSEDLLTLPVLALLATQLEPRALTPARSLGAPWSATDAEI